MSDTTKPALPEPDGYFYEVDGYFGIHRQFDTAPYNGMRPHRTVGYFTADTTRAAIEAAVAEARAVPIHRRPGLSVRLQQQCSDWGVYWRAPDAHGVNLSLEQAHELLRTALGVEVEIAATPSPTTRSQQLAAAGFTRRPSLWAMQAREALELIAAPRRPDGTWNRDREACRQLAAEALGRDPDDQIPAPAEQPKPAVRDIDTADIVRHKPSGESWVVAFVQEGRLCACGWPLGLVPVADCELVEKATLEKRDKLLREMADMNSSDPRSTFARAALQGEPHDPA